MVLRHIIRTVNAPITICVLSLLIGGAAGTYWTERSACLAQGHQEYNALSSMVEEYSTRTYLMFKALSADEANARKTVTTYWGQGPFIDKDFEHTGLHELESAYLRLRRRTLVVTPEAIAAAKAGNSAFSLIDTLNGSPLRPMFAAMDPAESAESFGVAADRHQIKTLVESNRASTMFEEAILSENRWTPSCGPEVLYKRIVSGDDGVPLESKSL